MPTSTTSFNLSALKARIQARHHQQQQETATKDAATPAPAPPPEKKSKTAAPSRRYIPRRSPGPNALTEVERALLLRSVIDVLRVKRPDVGFVVWHRYGLSRIYFADKSWLSYDAQGTAIYGPSKKTTAYAVRCELGLGRRARKGALL